RGDAPVRRRAPPRGPAAVRPHRRADDALSRLLPVVERAPCGGPDPRRQTVPAPAGGRSGVPLRGVPRARRPRADHVRLQRRARLGHRRGDAAARELDESARSRTGTAPLSRPPGESAARVAAHWSGPDRSRPDRLPGRPRAYGGATVDERPWTSADIPDQSGRIAVVTGANSGVGFETARQLAFRGAHVILAVRNESRGRAAAAAIGEEHPGASVEVRRLDLADLASVGQFADRFATEGGEL